MIKTTCKLHVLSFCLKCALHALYFLKTRIESLIIVEIQSRTYRCGLNKACSIIVPKGHIGRDVQRSMTIVACAVQCHCNSVHGSFYEVERMQYILEVSVTNHSPKLWHIC